MTPEERIALERKRYVHRRYEYCVAHHECVNCRKVDERTLAGHIRCAECYDKAYVSNPTPTPEKRARDAERKRQQRAARAGKRLCVGCGKQDYLTMKGKPLCAACQRRRDEVSLAYRQSGRLAEYQKSRREAFKAAGLCSKCGKNAPEPGRVMCTDCLVRDRMCRWRKRQETQGK